MKLIAKNMVAAVLVSAGLSTLTIPAQAATVDLQSLLREGLLGAGVGAISAGVGKGNAGTGALVGAGTQIIGSSLLSFLTTPSYSGQGQTVYAREQQVVAAQPVYYTQPQPVAYAQQPVTYVQPATPVYNYNTPQVTQDDSAKQILKQGLLGAGVGAISAGVGKGNAGTGALVGAGTQVIGSALLDFLVTPAGSARSSAQPAYYGSSVASARVVPAYGTSPEPTQRRIVRSYDAEGRLVSEEEFWQ
ncbi:MAG: hypothetical protein KBD07_01565 [Candidatus Omnitrophica bacterium]|jgi:hypothetical protein|nr:hypothetical protein [Candidatus Omnitrophota bacterium]